MPVRPEPRTRPTGRTPSSRCSSGRDTGHERLKAEAVTRARPVLVPAPELPGGLRSLRDPDTAEEM